MGFETRFDVFADDFEHRDWDTRLEGTVRLAVLGLGWFAVDHALPAIADCDYVEPTVVVSGSEEKATRVADEVGADAGLSYDGFHDGEATNAYDAVYVATPNATHLEYVESAAAHGKHVIVEKPLEATVERAERIVAACDDAGVALMTAYRMQTHPVLRRLRGLIADGFVGDVAQIEGSFTAPMLADAGDPNQWRLDPALAGGGSLYDLGVYPLNTTRFLLDADPVAVQSSLTSPHPEFDGIDEHAAFVLEFSDGVQALCRSSYGAHGENRSTIAGDAGAIRLENAYSHVADRTVAFERDGRTARFDDIFVNEITEQFDYFAHCVLTGADPEPDGEDGLIDMRVLEAVQESAETGRRIDLG